MKIDVAVDVAASTHQLWTYIADISAHAEWMHDAETIVFAGETRSGVGTEFDVRTKIGPLHTVDRMTITEWIENESIGVDHKGIVTGSGRFSLAAIGDRTTCRWTEEIHLPWMFGGRLGEIVAKPVLTLIWKRNLTELKRRVELGAGLPSDDQNLTPGALVGQGRDGDVRAYGPSKVIRISRSGADVSGAELLMEHVARAGYPVPRVYHHPDKSVSVMDRIDGPTMMADIAARPWRLREHARTLADLHDRLRTIAPPEGLRRLGPGNDLLHLDLHPNNILLTEDGPVVIDWSNAAIGSAGLDVALTWVLIKTGPITANPAIKPLLVGLREQFVKTYERAAGEDLIRAHATAAAELRLLDRNLLTNERDEVFRLARQLQDRPTHSRTDDA